MNNTNENNKNITFGKRLRELRKSRGFTQQMLAEKANMDEKHLCRIEKGKYFPNHNTLNNLLNALGIGIEEAGLNLENVSNNENSYYAKSMQILNTATEQELKYYYGLLKQAQKGIDILKN